MSSLSILGASGHGCVVADAALLAGFGHVQFFDDRWPTLETVGPWDVVGDTHTLVAMRGVLQSVIVAIGHNQTRLERHLALRDAGISMATIVHPTASVSPFAVIGEGCMIAAHAVIGPFAHVGEGSIVNTAATVDHDCQLAAGVHVSPGAHLGGNVRVGEATWIGIGAAIRHGTIIGRHVIVGAGSAVVHDIDAEQVVVGVPAHPHLTQRAP